jgi:hypothetical protein
LFYILARLLDRPLAEADTFFSGSLSVANRRQLPHARSGYHPSHGRPFTEQIGETFIDPPVFRLLRAANLLARPFIE